MRGRDVPSRTILNVLGAPPITTSIVGTSCVTVVVLQT